MNSGNISARTASSSVSIYEITITLLGTDPPVWRRVETPGNITLRKLHHIIQAVMPWQDYHLHMFTIDGVEYGYPDPELPCRSSAHAKLDKLAPAAGKTFEYLYDFGDGWQHELKVEKIGPPREDIEYPRCVTGKHACPPEDVGGVWGYTDFLEALRNPRHPDHRQYLEWIGGKFNPRHFSVAEANDRLLWPIYKARVNL